MHVLLLEEGRISWLEMEPSSEIGTILLVLKGLLSGQYLKV